MSSQPRRLKYPDAVSTFTRGEKNKHRNMYLPHEFGHMDEKFHKDTRAYNVWKRKTKKAARDAAKAAKKEGGTRRRHRKHRYTRRR
jgi:hypothetical protein